MGRKPALYAVGIAAAVCIAAVVIAAFALRPGRDGSTTNPSGGSQQAGRGGLTPLKLQLNWFAEPEHGGFYAAAAEGLYEQAGLAVEIIPGGLSTIGPKELAMGRVDFIIANADDLLLSRAAGVDLVAVAAPITHSPRCLCVREESPVRSFEELDGMTLLLDRSQAFVEFLQRQGHLEGCTIQPYSGSVAPLAQGLNYGCQGYSFSEPIVAEEVGLSLRTLMVSEIGFDPYCSLLITTRETVQLRPDLVKKMVAASMEGWRRYLADPTPANAIIAQANRQISAASLAQGAAAIEPLVDDAAAASYGRMDAARWQTLIGQMEDIEFLQGGEIAAEECFENVAPP